MRIVFNGAVVLAASVFLFSASPASAHVDIDTTGRAGARQVIEFTVGHGCAGADTVSVEIQLPPEVTSVRAVPWTFGEGLVATSSAGVPISVLWSKIDVLPFDDQFYSVAMRIGVPELPFSSLVFPVIQTCRSATGEESIAEWMPELRILPELHKGWNRITVESTIDDLSILDDAEIVWQGDAAYSANPTTMALITNTDDVAVLSELTAGTDVWVKY